MRKIIVFLINLYQKIISPYLPKSCRFYPTCSEYAKQAINKYGLIKGTVKSVKRLLKCHPLHEGGYDPVE
ncbi:MAG: membrane protein insertion efficiency factor YidD [Candidatus Goldbacteria bacterium]|nr:membrane protein insertion efficiency factor YidD [Candidatus Goldiibacteriota bacterium]HPD18368.1 membrane protein insertion efficiency factor YidD [Candidatus Goldiibacteriota bacterium]